MNIEELKQIEDLKIELDRLRKEYFDKLDPLMIKKVNETFTEFKQFFTTKGFEVAEESNSYSGITSTAKYGNLSATLMRRSFDNEERPWGVDFRFEFYVALPHKTQYYITMNRGIPSIGFSSGTSSVDSLKKQIEKMREKINNVNQEKWDYFLMQEEKKAIGNPYDSAPRFESVQDLLLSVVK